MRLTITPARREAGITVAPAVAHVQRGTRRVDHVLISEIFPGLSPRTDHEHLVARLREAGYDLVADDEVSGTGDAATGGRWTCPRCHDTFWDRWNGTQQKEDHLFWAHNSSRPDRAPVDAIGTGFGPGKSQWL